MPKRGSDKTRPVVSGVEGQFLLPLAQAKGGVATPPPLATQNAQYSHYIVYVDESGDHGLETVDPNYPVFVLAFCVFHKGHYAQHVVPAIESFKFRHFGHDVVILHEHEIRKEKGHFRFNDRSEKMLFLDELTSIIEANNFILISCVIDKTRLKERAQMGNNPYHLALAFCLETLFELMQEKKQDAVPTHVVVECRGKKEDRDLELEFRRICDDANRWSRPLPFTLVFADKKANSSGLQLADLVARPIGLSVLRPDHANRAFDVLQRKFFCKDGRRKLGMNYEGWGLKIFPPPESEKPR
ncbi:hypothetical protein LMG31886_43430 [Xanthomonas hydrangeae]|uniref:DUF3800 domain-containing protein n=1 Tax=Xanthomonas hydrangeae TaxID=2775159 RepID=A0AAU0BF01_9XANT|nr:DUF3800 domain-containing protein [Xanthomonas hydrangeae]WOB51502.1 DUF3800 domain-containing protein [Xanthomonas hydrangeae]CAD7730226.1 hypothetical protein LMG31884_44530 [Xanthomonas hydrangeae]CAD7730230.1 hypothetical protein LMG31884_44530 [Xanthomonas hydrangeae]CAD7731866.1 hypothetical protein LMG31885_16960 [Xanthomonas hydrangeae]CAD7731869.1 hypothetical protein LMG31885_16960 [Xanthomonas hydrangeae]